MTKVQPLIELQDIDGRIRELELELKDLPRRKALEEARLKGLEADLKAAKASREYVQNQIANLEAEAAALKEKISGLRTTQAGLKSNKEYAQYSMQIDLVSHDLEATENRQLAVMDDIPTADNNIKVAQEKYDAEKTGVDASCQVITDRIALVEGMLKEAQAERAEKVRELQGPEFSKMRLYYERIKTKRWPVVVPLTGEGVCGGCHLVQPPHVAQMVDRNTDMVACTMCGRILYRD